MTSSLPLRNALLASALALGAVFAGCGPAINQTASGVVAGTTAAIRVVNGSTDAGTIDVYLNATTNYPVGSGIPYGAMTIYVNFTVAPNITMLVQKTGTTTNDSNRLLSCTLPTLTAGNDYTVVIAGSKSSTTSATQLQCQIFPEAISPTLTSPNTAQVGFHHAAPFLAASGQSTVSFGTFTPASTPAPAASPEPTPPPPGTYAAPFSSPAPFTTPANNVAVGTAVEVPFPGVTSAPGVGIYASSFTTTVPTAAQIDAYLDPISANAGLSAVGGASDTVDGYPYPPSTLFDIYLIDPVSGTATPTLVGAFD